MKNKIIKMSDEVYYSAPGMVTFDQSSMQELVQVALKAPRIRARICTHENEKDIFQEMFIVHFKDTYVRPHFHKLKTESFHVIAGEADVVIFSDAGQVQEVISLGDYQSEKKFYYRIGPNVIHSLVIKSDTFIFHESTLGPFNREETGFPIWAPEDKDKLAIQNFLKGIGYVR